MFMFTRSSTRIPWWLYVALGIAAILMLLFRGGLGFTFGWIFVVGAFGIYYGLSMLWVDIFPTGYVEMTRSRGKEAVVTDSMPVGTVGTVDFEGKSWRARNIGITFLRAGEKCKIGKLKGMTLEVYEQS